MTKGKGGAATEADDVSTASQQESALVSQALAYPPEISLMMGAAVLVGGTLIFVATLLVVRWTAKRR